jgi:hypothetical protein
VDKKSAQIQKLEHILVARIEWIRAEYALAESEACSKFLFSRDFASMSMPRNIEIEGASL